MNTISYSIQQDIPSIDDKNQRSINDFNGYFISFCLKQMYETVDILNSKDSAFSAGTGEKIFREFLLNEYGKKMSDKFQLTQPMLQKYFQNQTQKNTVNSIQQAHTITNDFIQNSTIFNDIELNVQSKNINTTLHDNNLLTNNTSNLSQKNTLQSLQTPISQEQMFGLNEDNHCIQPLLAQKNYHNTIYNTENYTQQNTDTINSIDKNIIKTNILIQELPTDSSMQKNINVIA